MEYGKSITFDNPFPGIYVVTIKRGWELAEVSRFLETDYKNALFSYDGPYVLIWDVSAVKGVLPAGTLGTVLRKAPKPPNERQREKGRYGVGASEMMKQIGSLAARVSNTGDIAKYFSTPDEALQAAKAALEAVK